MLVDSHAHTLSLSLAPETPGVARGKGAAAHDSRRILKLNYEHHSKLRTLWDRMHPPEPPAQGARDAGTPSRDDAFNADLFSLLARYFSLQGHGFQAACSEHVMALFARRLGVTHECFASPLNCYFPSFCSAFADTDAAFGGQGSFWTWSPDEGVGGSFQANPPFVAHIMLRMVDRIDSFFSSAQATLALPTAPAPMPKRRKKRRRQNPNASPAPLSFVVVVPGWEDDTAVQRLTHHRLLRLFVAVPKADHGFCDGAQHQRRDRYRESPYDTFVYVLQNEAAAAQWSVAPGAPGVEGAGSFQEELLLAFAHARPTQAAIERRLKEGRGFADADGGGGVYKGKKQKQKKARSCPGVGERNGRGSGNAGTSARDKKSRRVATEDKKKRERRSRRGRGANWMGGR